MKITGNTILITGGGTGIGLGLAEAFQKRGNRVIIAGRRKDVLDAAVAKNAGMESAVLDVQDPAKVKQFAAEIGARFPELSVLINNAGIMKMENLLDESYGYGDAEAIINTNLLAPIRLTGALLPLLRKQPHATVMTVSSGLAFVPLAITPTYCATKAAIHSYSQSLRFQLRDTKVQVQELVPPYVATELMGPRGANDPRAMPLDDFIREVMDIIEKQPDAEEICVGRVHPLRNAEKEGNVAQVFGGMNAAWASASGH